MPSLFERYTPSIRQRTGAYQTDQFRYKDSPATIKAQIVQRETIHKGREIKTAKILQYLRSIDQGCLWMYPRLQVCSQQARRYLNYEYAWQRLQ